MFLKEILAISIITRFNFVRFILIDPFSYYNVQRDLSWLNLKCE